MTWHINTRLVKESDQWKVDFISLKYGIQQQLEKETRDVLLAEGRKFSESMREAISGSARELIDRNN